jgi:hypothetical protein
LDGDGPGRGIILPRGNLPAIAERLSAGYETTVTVTIGLNTFRTECGAACFGGYGLAEAFPGYRQIVDQENLPEVKVFAADMRSAIADVEDAEDAEDEEDSFGNPWCLKLDVQRHRLSCLARIVPHHARAGLIHSGSNSSLDSTASTSRTCSISLAATHR